MTAPPSLAAISEIEKLAEEAAPYAELQTLAEIVAGSQRLPLLALSFGNPDPGVPAIGFFGGVHGLERIGAEVVMAYARSIVKRLAWDDSLHAQLRDLRMVFMPLVNPGGVWLGTRANPQGIDLMRNAPLDAAEPVPRMIGGQRISPRLPWYRGPERAPMAAESAALCALTCRELLGRRFSLAVDCHSGFGMRDRIWFPYAHTRRPIRHLPEIHALHSIFEQTHAHHVYVFEPQSRQYLTHGDLWDYLYLQHENDPAHVFLPLTLEMGSWLWVKKNPRQVFSRQGIFNPLIAHRQQRVMRRHIALLDFFARATLSSSRWLPGGALREQHRQQAMALWYADDASR